MAANFETSITKDSLTHKFNELEMSESENKLNSEDDHEYTNIFTGHVLELLLSAVYLHKTATLSISSLLGYENYSNTEPNKPTSLTSTCNPEYDNSPNVGVENSANDKDASCISEQDPCLRASEVWNRLLTNPAIKKPEETMKLFKKHIQDGLLDSILPYLASSLNLTSDPATTIFASVEAVLTKSIDKCNASKSKKLPKPEEKEKTRETSNEIRGPTRNKGQKTKDNNDGPLEENTECGPDQEMLSSMVTSLPETVNDNGPLIVIHVCDEAHGLRQDFTCARDLLIHHIEYFAQVTAGQRLEDVDISVHCDVTIFDWLLKWVKKQDDSSSKAPILEPKNVISILISADFLRMTPLVEEVLQYIHKNANRILETQVNMSSLTESLLTKLSRLFNHWELESLRDPKDRLQNKLYARFVQMLCDVNPLPSKGIFRTAAYIYRCADCGKIVGRNVEKTIECTPANSCITITGHVYYIHSRDTKWNLTDHIKNLKTELKFWRWVYWRLWGQGCQFNDHTVHLTRSQSDIWGPIPQIYDDLLTFQLLICEEAKQEEMPSQKVIWKGVALIPHLRLEKSLLERSWLAEHRIEKGDGRRNECTPVDEKDSSGSPTLPSTEMVPESFKDLQRPESERESESSEDEEEGMKINMSKRHLPLKMKNLLLRKAAKAKRIVAYEIASEPEWRWDTTRSTRHNQDIQRDREVKIFKELTAWLSFSPTTSSEVSPYNATRTRHKVEKNRKDSTMLRHDPGTYYRLESDFKENFGNPEKHHGLTHPMAAFRAKVQAISRIKMRLRHRAAFSATR